MKIKIHIDYYVQKRVSKEEERDIDLQAFKEYVEEPVTNKHKLLEILQEFLWEGPIVLNEGKDADIDIDHLHIIDATEVLAAFNITCCSGASKIDHYCSVCGKKLR